MSVTLYAISLMDTSSVLAFCSLEKHDIADRPAHDALRDALVGDSLPIGLLPGASIPADALAIDEISQPPSSLEAVAYAWRVNLPSPQVVTPGDGTPKRLDPAADNLVTTIVRDPAPNSFRVKLKVSAASHAPVWLVFAGIDPRAGTFDPDPAKSDKEITFQFPLNLTIPTVVDAVFFMTGVPVVATPVS